MKTQQDEQAQEERQPSLIEEYRGPLLEDLREREDEVKLQPSVTAPVAAPEPAPLTTMQRIVLWLAAQCDWLRLLWRQLISPFRTADAPLNWARMGLLLQVLGVLLLTLAHFLSLGLLMYIGSTLRTVMLVFFTYGLFNSIRALLLYHRSANQRAVLILALLGHLSLVYLYLLWVIRLISR